MNDTEVVWAVIYDRAMQLFLGAGFKWDFENITDADVEALEILLAGEKAETLSYEILLLKSTRYSGMNVTEIFDAVKKRDAYRLHSFYLYATYNDDDELIEETSELCSRIENHILMLERSRC